MEAYTSVFDKEADALQNYEESGGSLVVVEHMQYAQMLPERHHFLILGEQDGEVDGEVNEHLV